MPPSPRTSSANAHEEVAIAPADNVFSYLMFMLPVESAKNAGRLSWNMILALGLTFGCLAFQFIILYCVYDAVVLHDVRWRESIMGPTQTLLPKVEDGQCNSGSSLCTSDNGLFSCAPPSVQLTGRWDELDTDADGIWTREEVLESREDLQCKYSVDPLEVFEVFVKFLLKREEHIWIHPDLRERKAINKAYFTYAKGDLIMCGYRKTSMCPNLVERGVFDVPLVEGKSPRVGDTVDSALDYCYALLEDGGICDRTLPSTYSTWKKSSDEQCFGESFEKYLFKHPITGEQKSLLTIDYQATEDYSRASSNRMFLTFKTIIIGLFFLAMWAGVKDVWAQFTFVSKFPSASKFDGKEVRIEDSGEETTYKIMAVSGGHRAIILVIVFLRTLMNITLVYIGVTFLQKDTDWINLLLNAVALTYVLEISNYLYAQLLDIDTKNAYESLEPLRVEMLGSRYLNSHPAIRDILGVFFVFAIVITCMTLQKSIVTDPLHKALRCACLSEGETCREAHVFDKKFWDNYWGVDVPNVFNDLKELQEGHKVHFETEDTPVTASEPDESQSAFPILSRSVASMHPHEALSNSDSAPKHHRLKPMHRHKRHLKHRHMLNR